MFDPWEVVREQGLEVEWDLLPRPYRGFYVPLLGEPGVIILDARLDERGVRSVLSEELGHHMTSGLCYPSRWATDPERELARSAAELRGLRWALDRLIPTAMFSAMLARGWGFEDLADFYCVLPEFVQFKIGLTLAEPAAVWKAG